MKINKAIRLAIQAIEFDMQRLAVAANLYEHYGAELPHTITASRQRKEYLEAIEILQALEEQTYSVNKKKGSKPNDQTPIVP